MRQVIRIVFLLFFLSFTSLAQQPETYLIYSDSNSASVHIVPQDQTNPPRSIYGSWLNQVSNIEVDGKWAYVVDSTQVLSEHDLSTETLNRQIDISPCFVNGVYECHRTLLTPSHYITYNIRSHQLLILDRTNAATWSWDQIALTSTINPNSNSKGGITMTPNGDYLYLTIGQAGNSTFPLQVVEVRMRDYALSPVNFLPPGFSQQTLQEINQIKFWNSPMGPIGTALIEMNIPGYGGATDVAIGYIFPGLAAQSYPLPVNSNQPEFDSLDIHQNSGVISFNSKTKVHAFDLFHQVYGELSPGNNQGFIRDIAWTNQVLWIAQDHQYSWVNSLGIPKVQAFSTGQQLVQLIKHEDPQSDSISIVVGDSGSHHWISIDCVGVFCGSTANQTITLPSTVASGLKYRITKF